MLQDITRTIGPGEPSIFDMAGGSLACIAADLPDFAIRFDNDPEATFRVGFEYTPPGGFRRFQVRNTRAAPLTVTFTVAEGQFRDRRQISSAPQTFQPTTLEDHRGTSYFGGTVAVSASASNAPRVWIDNPAGSGVLSVVQKLWLGAFAGAYVQITPDNIAAPAPAFPNIDQGAVFSTFAGDPDGQTHLYTDESVGSFGFGGGRSFRVPLDAVGFDGSVFLQSPIIVPSPGRVSILSSLIGAGSTLVVGVGLLEVPSG